MAHNNIELLAFGPHPDDVELYCGGTLADAASRGYRTGVADLTRGELSSRGTLESRAEETERAAEMLRLSVRENLNLPDGGISEHAPEQLEAVIACIRRLRPEIILAPYRYERHPDHEQASALITRAVFFAGLLRFKPELGAQFTPRKLLFYPMRYEARPSFIVDISNTAQVKASAVKCYRSQLYPHGPEAALAELPPTLIGSAQALFAHQGRDNYYGSMIGVAAGEPFVTINALALADPLSFFRSSPGQESYFSPSVI